MVFLKTDQGTYLELPIPSTFSVGRGSSSAIKPDSKSVSKRHGQIIVERNAKTGKAETWVEDFNSTFGTYVGESPASLEKITEKTRLFFGFYIRFGHAPACFQYLEHKEEDFEDDTTQAHSVQIPAPDVKPSLKDPLKDLPKEKQRPPPITALPTHQLTDEELAIQMQFGQPAGDSPSSRLRTKDLIQQFEAKARPTSTSPSTFKELNSRKSSASAGSEKFNDAPVPFVNETSMRDMLPQSSFMSVENGLKLAHPAESFSDLLWEESQTAQPTPTVCLPPGKVPQNFKDSDYGFAYDLDEKPGAEEVVDAPPPAQSPRSRSVDTVRSPRASSPPVASSPRAAAGGTFAAPPAPRPTSTAQSGSGASSPRNSLSPRSVAAPTQPALSEGEQALVRRNQIIDRARLAFRQQKASVLPEAGVQYDTYYAVARQWRKATITLDSVAGGFCISTVLPFLERVKVKPAGAERHKVLIDARRWIDAADTYATDADSEYLIEFKLRGLTSEIHQEDLSYNYDVTTGLLCVFINRLKLKNDQLLVKKKSIPLITKGEYVKAASPKSLTTKPAREPLTMRSLFSWVPGVTPSREHAQKTHEEAAKTYKKVLSRKSSMLTEGAGVSGGAGPVPMEMGDRVAQKMQASAPPAEVVHI